MLAAGTGNSVPRIQGDVCRLPISSESVDGVYAAYVVQNVPAWRDALAEIGRILKPDRVALIAFGGPPADEVSSQLARHYFRVLGEIGAERVGVAAESTGLRSLTDVLTATTGVGLSLTGVHYIAGQQTRSRRGNLLGRSPRQWPGPWPGPAGNSETSTSPGISGSVIPCISSGRPRAVLRRASVC
jgi:SAM-dependent methyltransferase